MSESLAILTVQAAMLAAVVGLVAAFGGKARARRSAARIAVGVRSFRLAMITILVGIAMTSIADAIRSTANLSAQDARYVQPTLVGILLILAGLVAINVVLAWPRTDEPAPAEASKP